MKNYLYEIQGDWIFRTELSSDFFGGRKALRASLSSKLGQEWAKALEQSKSNA